MNQILIKNLRLLVMLRAYLMVLLVPVYFCALYYSPPIKGILYVFTVVIVCGPLASLPEATELKNRTHMIFCSLPISRKQIALGNFYTGYILLGLTVMLIFISSVLMHVLSPRWPIMTFAEMLFILIIVCLEDLLETVFSDFYFDVSEHPLKFVFVISFFFLMSFLVYPYLIASIYRLDFSWPRGSNPMRVTLAMLAKPLPAVVVCLLLLPFLGLIIKLKIRYFENKDI